MSEEQQEAKLLLEAIDLLADNLSDWEVKFVSNLIDKWTGDFTTKQIRTIEMIADRHNIL